MGVIYDSDRPERFSTVRNIGGVLGSESDFGENLPSQAWLRVVA